MKKLIYNTLWIAFTELLMIHVCLIIMHSLYSLLLSLFTVSDTYLQYFLNEALIYILFSLPIIICLLYMRHFKPESLKIFTEGSFKKKLKSFLLGLLIGTVLNGFVSLLCGISGTIDYSFRSFGWYQLAIFPFVFVQCSSEEVLLRGYVPAFMEERHDWSTIAFVSGTLFIFHHTNNMAALGFSVSFCLNVFLVGVIFYMLTKMNGCFWIACGVHTAWNYLQEYIFGLPNSGASSPIALFTGNNPKDNFFFNTVFGHEGSMLTTMLFVIVIVILLIRGRFLSAEEKND